MSDKLTNEEKERRRGHRPKEGAVKWPEVSISGHLYERTQSTIALGDGYFAVLDHFMAPRLVQEMVEQLQIIVTIPKGKSPSESA